MFRFGVLAAVCLALASTAAGATPAVSVTSPAPVQTLAFDAPQLAFATPHSARDCDRIRIRNRATGRTVRLGRSTHCEETSTGGGIAALATARNRVLWLHFAGGNIREWSLFTATATAPRPRRLRFVARDVDAPPPIVVGHGDGSRFGDLLPYAVDREVVVLRANGSRAFTWTASARVTALGANAGGAAVASADGRILALENGEAVFETRLTAAATAVFVTGNAVAAQVPRELVVLSGSAVRRWPLPAGARVRDAEGSRAVYLTRGRARLIDLGTGRTRDLGRAADVQLEGATVAVAFGRTIRLVRAG